MQALKLLEDKARGQSGFPIEVYHIDQHHPRYVMPLHWHDECELIWVRSGRFDYEVGAERAVATAGDLLFVNSGLLHGGMPQNCVYQCVVFELGMLTRGDELCRALLAPFAEGRMQVQLRLPAADLALAAAVHDLFEVLWAQPEGYALQVHGLLYRFFGLAMAGGYTRPAAGDGVGAQKKLRQLKKALALIENEYTQPLTLEQLARAAGMSPKHFCQMFHQLTRRTPIDYLNHHRIEAARTLLAQGAANATEVAYECGFNDLSYFIRVFKRYAGVTPKQYAKRWTA